jgi:ankyrin repeat protein
MVKCTITIIYYGRSRIEEVDCIWTDSAVEARRLCVAHYRETMVKSPTLYRLAADRQYGRIPARVQSNEDDLLWTDRYGSTALHILCQARNVDQALLLAVDAILQRAPEQVAWANIATWTPLHFAVEKRLFWGGDSYTTALILRLIQACPSAVSLRTHAGFKTKTPFHIACEADADYKVLKAMLKINPALATAPYADRDLYSVTETPLQLLWKTHQHQQSGTIANTFLDEQAERKMALLLQAAHLGTVAPLHRSFRLLDAASSVKTPRDYFSKILAKHKAEASVPDGHGLYALHYAVRSASGDSQVYTQFVVQSLLAVYPEAAACRDNHGRLPLHVAIEKSHMTWHKGGLRELTYRNASALGEVDPIAGLPPFLASAEAATRSRLHLSTTYELLRMAPDVLLAYRCRADYVD